MAPVGEHGQLHPVDASVVEQSLDRGSDGAARVEDIVDHHHRALGHVEVDVGGVQHRRVGAA